MTTIETRKEERHVTVLSDRCAGCQECVIRCPVNALSMDHGSWTVLADDDLCVGCRQCERTCPFSAIQVGGPMAVTDRLDPPLAHPVTLRGDISETREGYSSWSDVLKEASRCLECPDPTCVRGCPAHNDIPGFIGALRQQDLSGAHEILARTSVLPDVCSRVCNQSAQCEGACTWSLAGTEPVAIGRLERFIADQMMTPAPTVDPSGAARDLSVAIVGAGPAAVGAAWDLVEAGAAVTVFEKDDTVGGLCLWGMPEFTLPSSVAMRAWEQLETAGVEIRRNHAVDADEIEVLLREHDAVIAAHGAGVSVRLPVPGMDLEGVVDATLFLKGAKEALEPMGSAASFLHSLGLTDTRAQRVLVLGAGNTAMDVARMARRLGLDATCVDWLDERFALARPDELAEARHEGVDVLFQRTVVKVEGSGRVHEATLAHTTQASATHTPKVVPTASDTLRVDLVVMAMGYRVDASFASVLPGLPVRKVYSAMASRQWVASGVLANPASSYAHHSPVGHLALAREVGLNAAAMPVAPRLWVVGDALTGPSTVVEAMAQGRRAARAIMDAQPNSPSRSTQSRELQPRRILVCFESEGGSTADAAQRIGAQLREYGARVDVMALEKVGPMDLAHADAIVVGTWVEGLVVAKVHPAKATRQWLDALPWLGGRPVGVFCTYGVDPRGALAEMRKVLEAKGAQVGVERALGRRDLKNASSNFAQQFAESMMQTVLR
ncbi:MAG: FAD-dependent oxidoreductase [Acidimicrobiaceae bacterium]|nr:FAD-dependent oxidoreductase [Acidimicrobiaceae bacterium]